MDLIRKPNDRRTLTIVVPYAIRVKDQCWSRKWGGHDVGGKPWEGGCRQQEPQEWEGRRVDSGGEVARR